jgi:hypothetical protein
LAVGGLSLAALHGNFQRFPSLANTLIGGSTRSFKKLSLGFPDVSRWAVSL